MKSKKLLLSILLVASVLFGAALAQAADVKTYTTKLTLTVPKTAANTNYDEAYLLEVPADFTITQAGWNSLGAIKISHDTTAGGEAFSTDKKVVVTAGSAHSWSLALSGDNTQTIGYTLKVSEDAASATKQFTFTAAQINAGASQEIGVSVEDYSGKTAGEYEDTITYTVSVQYATLSLTNGDNVSMTFSAGGTNYSITGTFDGSSFNISSQTPSTLNMEWSTDEGGNEFIYVVNGSDLIVVFNLTKCTYSPYQENTTLTSITIGDTDVTSSFSLPNSEAEK